MLTVGSFLLAAVVLVTSVVALRGFRSEWRGHARSDPNRAPDWWPLDLLWWRALLRSGPIGTVEGPIAAAGTVVATLDGWGAQDVVGSVLTGLATIVLVLTGAVALYNRPRVLVVPHLRGLPGALEDLDARRPTGSSPPRRNERRPSP